MLKRKYTESCTTDLKEAPFTQATNPEVNELFKVSRERELRWKVAIGSSFLSLELIARVFNLSNSKKLALSTKYSAVSLLAAVNVALRQKGKKAIDIDLCVVTCILICSKLHGSDDENDILDCEDIIELLNNEKYKTKRILEMELYIIDVLKFQLSYATPFEYLEILFIVYFEKFGTDLKLVHIANCIMELTYQSTEYILFEEWPFLAATILVSAVAIYKGCCSMIPIDWIFTIFANSKHQMQRLISSANTLIKFCLKGSSITLAYSSKIKVK